MNAALRTQEGVKGEGDLAGQLLALRDILHTSMARYSLFVLKVPLNAKKANKHNSICMVWYGIVEFNVPLDTV